MEPTEVSVQAEGSAGMMATKAAAAEAAEAAAAWNPVTETRYPERCLYAQRMQH